MLDELLFEHPRAVGETYGEHQRRAFWFAGQFLKAGFAALVHGLVPGLCKTTGSDTVKRLHGELTGRRDTAVESGLSADQIAGAHI